jgi:hypothetical protein
MNKTSATIKNEEKAADSKEPQQNCDCFADKALATLGYEG